MRHLIVGEDARAFKVEAESHFPQALLAHGMAEPVFFMRVEHEKSSAACADQLATQSAVGHGKVVPFINGPVRHLRAAAFLVLPVNVHQTAKFGYVSLLKGLFAGDSELLHEMEVLYHFGICVTAPVVLLLEN